MRPRNPLGDHGQRAITLPLIFEPVLANEDAVGVSAPLTHQCRAGLQYDIGIERRSASLELSGEGLQPALQGPARPAMDPLLQLIGEGSDQQIATEPLRWSGAMQLTPGKPQFVRRPIHQFGNLAVDLGDVRPARPISPLAASSGNERRLARVLASRSVVDWGLHALAGAAMR